MRRGIGSERRWATPRSLVLGASVLTLAGLAVSAERWLAFSPVEAVSPDPVRRVRVGQAPVQLARLTLSEPDSRRALGSSQQEFLLQLDLPIVEEEPVSLSHIANLVEDLRDDDVRHNAMKAVWKLEGIGTRAAPALRAALSSPDGQQRHLSANLLRRQGADDQHLLRVTLEGLRQDQLPWTQWNVNGAWFSYNHWAAESAEWLSTRASRAWPELRARLYSDDDRERFLVAFLLAWSRCPREQGRTTDILISHLHDNDISKDAIAATGALYKLGSAAVPFLERARGRADEQAGELITLLLEDIRQPPDLDRLGDRGRRQHITRNLHDPAVEFHWSNLRMWSQREEQVDEQPRSYRSGRIEGLQVLESRR